MLRYKDLAHARREFGRTDPILQGAIMAEMSRREKIVIRREQRQARRRRGL